MYKMIDSIFGILEIKIRPNYANAVTTAHCEYRKSTFIPKVHIHPLGCRVPESE